MNIGNGKPISLIGMVKKLYAIMGKPENLQFIDQQAGYMPITCANISKAKALLGYSPKVSFDDGLTLFMAWFEGQQVKVGQQA
jgi:UDP-glucuronate 4-epimerase